MTGDEPDSGTSTVATGHGDTGTGKPPTQGEASRVWSQGPVFFPDVLETSSDAPLLLGSLLGADRDGLHIVEIDGTSIDATAPTPLPGIRVGAGGGAGFVFRRELDGELVFVPDAEFAGIATIAVSVADAFGGRASFVATVNVHRHDDGAEIAFADGSQHASVAEGLDGAIVGALTLLGIDAGQTPVFRVYEDGSDEPSARFVVSGERLQARAPLDHAADGTISLRIVASEGVRELAASDFAIEVRPADSAEAAADQFHFRADVDGPSGPLDMPAIEPAIDPAAEVAAETAAGPPATLDIEPAGNVVELPVGRGEPFVD